MFFFGVPLVREAMVLENNGYTNTIHQLGRPLDEQYSQCIPHVCGYPKNIARV